VSVCTKKKTGDRIVGMKSGMTNEEITTGEDRAVKIGKQVVHLGKLLRNISQRVFNIAVASKFKFHLTRFTRSNLAVVRL
jgi:hypothetical protein